MVIDAILENVAIYNLHYKLDVKVGQKLTLVMDKPEDVDGVFADNDKVLSFEHKGTDINIDILTVGVSKIRIMKAVVENQNPIIREILFNAVESIQRPATTLNATFGPGQPK